MGIDNDPDHIRMADDALRKAGITNVEFRLLDFEEHPDELGPESFDFVFSQRGPIDNDAMIQAALRLLRYDGLIFSEDPRFRLFAERNTVSTGGIATTHHVTRVGGAKR